ncbi:MAG: sigma-70 family RNA polymerase sigma factor [Chloroflexota bacterium]
MLSLSDLSDNELLSLCQARLAKDDRPFQELFYRYQTLVWRICFSFTHNQQDAEDLSQEVFFRAYRGLTEFQERSSLKTWLYRIALNVCQNEVDRRASRPPVVETEVGEMAEILAGGSSAETEYQSQAKQEQLAQALARLPAEAYEALYLKDLEQRSYVEIAEMLEITLSAAKMRVQRARLALQLAYRQLDREG